MTDTTTTAPRIDVTGGDLGARLAKRFATLGFGVMQSTLPRRTQELVMLRVSQINGCGFCVDLHTKEATAAGETATRLHLVAAWRHSTVFTEAERAALALAEEGTRLADGQEGVSDATWQEVRKHYDEEQTTALVYLVAVINAANRLSVIAHNQGGSYEPGMIARLQN
ncbi:carboxymuconolactone decarboxylase family protein [Streptomyces nogalater]|uniref:Carboxymuconolactone decarboxylase family protein n=1 Tax=Streptomyces nogalater TaxID=38314 RepID=A0ABW0WJ78_STRNO